MLITRSIGVGLLVPRAVNGKATVGKPCQLLRHSPRIAQLNAAAIDAPIGTSRRTDARGFVLNEAS